MAHLDHAKPFREHTKQKDIESVERVVRATGVFSAPEIAIARELVEENLAKGDAVSGYRFIIADGRDGIDGYTCYGPISGTEHRYELYWIAVRPDTRGTGLARRLLNATEDAVRKSGWPMAFRRNLYPKRLRPRAKVLRHTWLPFAGRDSGLARRR